MFNRCSSLPLLEPFGDNMLLVNFLPWGYCIPVPPALPVSAPPESFRIQIHIRSSEPACCRSRRHLNLRGCFLPNLPDLCAVPA
jgi:hypothetical protein